MRTYYQSVASHGVIRPRFAEKVYSRGGNLPWFWVRMCGWSPRTPPHSYTRPSEKHDPFIYFPYRKLTPFIYYFWKLTPFIYYFSNFTHSYTFWVKKIPHWYTFDVKMIPIHILGGLKSIPHSSRTSVYTFIMEVTPPWVYFILLFAHFVLVHVIKRISNEFSFHTMYYETRCVFYIPSPEAPGYKTHNSFHNTSYGMKIHLRSYINDIAEGSILIGLDVAVSLWRHR